MAFQHAPVCQGLKRNGQPCSQPAVRGRVKCRVHGGSAGRGIAAQCYGKLKPGSRGLPGAQSKFIPVKLAADYRRAQQDPERLSLLHEISTWAAREQQLLRRFKEHDAGASWGHVANAWDSIEQAKAALDLAQANKDIPGMRVAYGRFQDAIAQGKASITHAKEDYGLWKEIKDVHTMLMHLRNQEHKRLMELQRYWNAEQVAVRWGQFLHALWEAATTMLPKEHIRPLLRDFGYRMRSIDAEFSDMQATPTTPTTTELDSP